MLIPAYILLLAAADTENALLILADIVITDASTVIENSITPSGWI